MLSQQAQDFGRSVPDPYPSGSGNETNISLIDDYNCQLWLPSTSVRASPDSEQSFLFLFHIRQKVMYCAQKVTLISGTNSVSVSLHFLTLQVQSKTTVKR